jgi:hypothetical protein
MASVSGCGGGGEGGTTGDAGASVRTTTETTSAASTTTTTATKGAIPDVHHPTSPTAAVRLLLLSSDARAVCSSDLVTSHYLRAAYGGREACLNAVSSKNTAQSLRTASTRITDGTATVTVTPAGGLYDGEKITVSLTRSGSGWKVDAIRSNAPVGP